MQKKADAFNLSLVKRNHKEKLNAMEFRNTRHALKSGIVIGLREGRRGGISEALHYLRSKGLRHSGYYRDLTKLLHGEINVRQFIDSISIYPSGTSGFHVIRLQQDKETVEYICPTTVIDQLAGNWLASRANLKMTEEAKEAQESKSQAGEPAKDPELDFDKNSRGLG